MTIISLILSLTTAVLAYYFIDKLSIVVVFENKGPEILRRLIEEFNASKPIEQTLITPLLELYLINRSISIVKLKTKRPEILRSFLLRFTAFSQKRGQSSNKVSIIISSSILTMTRIVLAIYSIDKSIALLDLKTKSLKILKTLIAGFVR